MLQAHERQVAEAYEAHRGPLVRHLTAITRDPADAEDLAQDAFLRLAAEVAAGRAPDDTGAWLHRVGWNLAMSRGRRRSVADRRIAELARPSEPSQPDRIVIGREAGTTLASALETLRPVESEAILLAANGRRGDEVAAALGRSAGATRTLLCRARAKLRLVLDQEALVPA
ncbi:MAG TPA: RNA polymerase sigma factor [Candidatus Limnocylindrales bacterium]|nr:RNA polymerase sigma factor [Candidatus Limnocylindrales bacterium]